MIKNPCKVIANEIKILGSHWLLIYSTDHFVVAFCNSRDIHLAERKICNKIMILNEYYRPYNCNTTFGCY